jgi:DNA-directed RNA polymerase specialized sigma24 family protein
MTEGHPTEWLARHRSGDSDAAGLIFSHFAQRLCHLAQRHLSSRVRPRCDGEDVVQSAFRTFFVRDAQGEFRIDSSDDLWRLLVRITQRKARGVWRKHSAGRRDVARESPLSGQEGDGGLADLAREPTVVEALVLADEIETLLLDLSASHAQALELRLAGHTVSEAAEIMGLTRQSFYRLLEPLQERLERSIDAAGA